MVFGGAMRSIRLKISSFDSSSSGTKSTATSASRTASSTVERQVQTPSRSPLSQVRVIRLSPPKIGRHHVFQHNMKARRSTGQSKTPPCHSSSDHRYRANLERGCGSSRFAHFLLATAVITDS